MNGESSGSYRTTLNFLGQFYASARRFKEAEATYRQALAVFQNGDNADKVSSSVSLSGLGDVLLAQGKTKEADEALRQSLKGFDDRKRGNDRDRYLTLNILIEECVKTKCWEEAIEHCTASRQAGRRWLAHILPPWRRASNCSTCCKKKNCRCASTFRSRRNAPPRRRPRPRPNGYSTARRRRPNALPRKCSWPVKATIRT